MLGLAVGGVKGKSFFVAFDGFLVVFEVEVGESGGEREG